MRCGSNLASGLSGSMTSFPPPNQGRLVSLFGTPQIVWTRQRTTAAGFGAAQECYGVAIALAANTAEANHAPAHFKAACVVFILRTRLAPAKGRPFTQLTVATPPHSIADFTGPSRSQI